jgi:hypothetical protein
MDRRLDVRVDLVAALADDLDRVDLLDQPLRQPVDLRLGRLAAREDSEVDDERRTPSRSASNTSVG